MRRYRIGNDISIFWTITNNDGTPYPLVAKDINLYYSCERGRFKVPAEVRDGNVIYWVFSASMQRTLGEYTLTLQLVNDGKAYLTKDIYNAFELVGSSINAHDEEDGSVLNGGEIRLASDFKIVPLFPIADSVTEGVQAAVSSDAVAKAFRQKGSPDWDASADQSGYIKNRPFYNTVTQKFDANKFRFDYDLGSFYMPISSFSGDDLYIMYRNDYGSNDYIIKYFSIESPSSFNFFYDPSTEVQFYIGEREDEYAFIAYIDNEDSKQRLQEELDTYFRYCTRWADDYTPVVKTIPDYYISGNIARKTDIPAANIDPIVWKYICNPLLITSNMRFPDELLGDLIEGEDFTYYELKYPYYNMYRLVTEDGVVHNPDFIDSSVITLSTEDHAGFGYVTETKQWYAEY